MRFVAAVVREDLVAARTANGLRARKTKPAARPSRKILQRPTRLGMDARRVVGRLLRLGQGERELARPILGRCEPPGGLAQSLPEILLSRQGRKRGLQVRDLVPQLRQPFVAALARLFDGPIHLPVHIGEARDREPDVRVGAGPGHAEIHLHHPRRQAGRRGRAEHRLRIRIDDER